MNIDQKSPPQMRPAALILVSYILLLAACSSPAPPNQFPIMGNLTPGEHTVGFKTLFIYDQSKPGVPYSNWDGKLFNDHQASLGRQHQVNIWYPSIAGSGAPLKYHHYVDLLGRQTNFNDTDSQKVFARALFIDQTNALGGNGTFTTAELKILLELDVTARLNAKVESIQYPVVVFPNGSSPAFQSIMAEYLASNGYVVVALAPKGRYSSGMEISGIGLENAVDDLEFVLSKISTLSYVDMNQVALIGNAISSSVCVAAVARNKKIKSLVSLEGGFPSAFEQRLLQESVFYEPENIQIPLLVIYAPYPDIDPKFTYHLKYASRYYAHFPEMSEFAMLNFGMFDTMIPDIIGVQKGNTQQGYETANNLVRRFLDIHLKQDDLTLFDEEFLTTHHNTIDSTFVLQALAAPPTVHILKDLFLKHGFQAIDSIYRSLQKQGNAQPLSESFYPSFRDWLSWNKDPDYDSRLHLYTLAHDSYPESLEVHYYLAYYSKQQDRKEAAIHHYNKVITLMDSDQERLNRQQKARMLKNSQEALLELQ